jgi:tetratricopeptide (TPR) repeat protein
MGSKKRFWEALGRVAIVITILGTLYGIGKYLNKSFNKKKHESEILNKLYTNKDLFSVNADIINLFEEIKEENIKLKKDLEKFKDKVRKPSYKKIIKKSIKKFNNYKSEEFHNILKEYEQTIDAEIVEDINIKAEIAFLRARAYYIELDYNNSLLLAEKAVNINPQNTDYLLYYANRLEDMVLYDKAIEYYNITLEIENKKKKKDKNIIGKCYNDIGLCYSKKGNYDLAIEYYYKAKEIFGDKTEQIPTIYNNTGLAYGNKGEYDKAIEFHRKALKIFQEILGEKHPSTATSYNNIGTAYNHKGEYDKAIEFYQKALKIKQEILGEKHPSTATTYNNIGTAYDHKGEYDRAIEFHQKALIIRLEILGEKHPYTAESYNNMGGAYFHKKDINKAIEYIKKALSIVRELNDEAKIKLFEENLESVLSIKNKQG